MLWICRVAVFSLILGSVAAPVRAEDTFPNARKPSDDVELKYWLENMSLYHHYTLDEMQRATGLPKSEIKAALKRFELQERLTPERKPGDVLTVKPYPGGRHPRIGFLEGAIDPQRETKISVFAPWDPTSYVVLDLPEAIWSNLGLTYLAHTHVPTIWTKQNLELDPLEWSRHQNGNLSLSRTLPNGIAFGTQVVPRTDSVLMEMWLKNGTDKPLSKLRVQNCAMLKKMDGFTQQDNENKLFRAPYAACRSVKGNHWVIMAWTPCFKAWGNTKCPCLHSDPIFPDCPPGETRRVRGWFSFYTGTDIEGELKRIDASGWQTASLKQQD
ncbi:hypothetical protein Pan153_56870 [Gimesia panareensis]|uniref:Uncharacterized protein n=1 Tax=Gimesia panareensis TaxID=2527978 RepID=A0A518FX97_9PLAN|nr:hypothetical protein [Gimesia panareensis]QDV21005.1 hypothetical protein Pan153_56870 [Gimesia panareensis]